MARGQRSPRNKLFNTLRTVLRWLSPNRAVQLTTEGTRFLLLTLAVGVTAINTGNNLFYLLLAMMLSLIVLSGLLSEQCVRRLEFHRHLPEYLFANESATVSLWIANRKSCIPSVSLRLFDVVDGQDIDRKVRLSHLAPHSSTLVSYPLLVRRRGPYRFDGVRVVTPFPFGLFHKKAFYGSEATIVVCPEIRGRRKYDGGRNALGVVRGPGWTALEHVDGDAAGHERGRRHGSDGPPVRGGAAIGVAAPADDVGGRLVRHDANVPGRLPAQAATLRASAPGSKAAARA